MGSSNEWRTLYQFLTEFSPPSSPRSQRSVSLASSAETVKVFPSKDSNKWASVLDQDVMAAALAMVRARRTQKQGVDTEAHEHPHATSGEELQSLRRSVSDMNLSDLSLPAGIPLEGLKRCSSANETGADHSASSTLGPLPHARSWPSARPVLPFDCLDQAFATPKNPADPGP